MHPLILVLVVVAVVLLTLLLVGSIHAGAIAPAAVVMGARRLKDTPR